MAKRDRLHNPVLFAPATRDNTLQTQLFRCSAMNLFKRCDWRDLSVAAVAKNVWNKAD